MIPIRDSNPSGTMPVVTVALIVLNALVWFYEVSLGSDLSRFIAQYGLTPARMVGFHRYPGGLTGNALEPLLFSMFMHGGWLHVIGNMWFLWVFGDNIEDRLGHFRFLLFYILCGIGASLIHVAFQPYSRIPTVGASGAISGVLGAYLLSFPQARVHTLFIILVFVRYVEVPAFVFLVLWFGFQLLSGASQIGAHHDLGGVAYWAHIGGFIVGVVLVLLMRKNPGRRVHSWQDDRPRLLIRRGR